MLAMKMDFMLAMKLPGKKRFLNAQKKRQCSETNNLKMLQA